MLDQTTVDKAIVALSNLPTYLDIETAAYSARAVLRTYGVADADSEVQEYKGKFGVVLSLGPILGNIIVPLGGVQ